MFKKTALSLVILFATTLFLSAQTSSKAVYTVKGIVTDSVSHQTVPFCTVSASKAKMPHVYLKRMAADVNGSFTMTFPQPDTLIFKFESVGIKPFTKTVIVTEKTTDLGKLLMSGNEKVLSEVTITATKPLVKVDLDKITYDMKSDPEAITSNAFDMLKKVPMVTVDAEEKIQVKGKTNFKIFINGKPSNLTSGNPTDILKSMPAANIKNIEVITQPGAKYEAEGLSGIINIVTEKAVVGYMGSVNAGVDNFGGYNGGAYFTTKLGKFGISTNLNYGSYRRPNGTNWSERLNKITNDTLYQAGASKNNGRNQYGNIELSYEIDSLNLITLSGSGWGGKYGNEGTSNSYQVNTLGVKTQQFHQIFDMSGTYGGYETNLNYQKSFKKPDKLFTLSYQLSLSPGGNESTNDIVGDLNYFSRKQRLKSDSEGTEHTFQADYVDPLTKNHIIDFGLKYIIRINGSDNSYEVMNPTTKQWEPMQGMPNNDMNQNQKILGAYSDYTFKLDKFSVRAGARLEHTTTKVDFKHNPSLNFDVPPFTNLVPSLRFNYKLTEMMTMQLGYNQRISRPGIWYLNPFRDESDPTSVRQGNPNLKTEISNSVDLNYSYFTPKLNVNVSLSSSFTNNSIERTTELVKEDNGKTYQYSTFANIGRSNSNGLYAYMRWQATSKLSLNINSDLSYTKYKTGLAGIDDKEGFQYGFYVGSNYKLPLDFTLNLNGRYSSPWISLQGKYSPWYYYGVSLNKAFLNKKLNITLRANGFLQENMSRTNSMETPTFRSESEYTYPFRSFGLSVSYRFGQMKEQIKTTKRSIKNDDVKSGGGNSGGGGGGN